jgi:predicted aspartyl protease
LLYHCSCVKGFALIDASETIAKGKGDLGEVKVEVELENAVDREMVLRGQLKEESLRAFKVSLLVDSGAVMLMLPQDQVEALGLRETGKVIVTYADERRDERPLAGVVTVRVGNRAASVNCVVGPPNSEPLLGQVLLEMMDLLVDCTQQKLVPRPESPFLPLLKMK